MDQGLAAQMRRQVFDRIEAENATLVALPIFRHRALDGWCGLKDADTGNRVLERYFQG